MSTLFLLDAENSPGNERFLSVAFGTDTIDSTGGFVIRIPDTIDFEDDLLQDIPDPNTLIARKYAAILASYPGFTTIVFDDLRDTSGINLANTSGARIGGRGGTYPLNTGLVNYIETVPVALGATPVEAVVTWEVFTSTLTNPKDGRLTRQWNEEISEDLDVGVSFNNGLNFNTVTDGALINIAPAHQGSDLIIRCNLGASAAGVPRGFGSWAVIF